MKIDISAQHLMLLASALNDAIKYNEGFLNSETISDISDYEEHLLCLEQCQSWLEDEYQSLEKQGEKLVPYNKVVRKV